ncbi:MAG TPA: lytic transglycosylase domain-containing protein [Usitatibacter sp.]
MKASPWVAAIAAAWIGAQAQAAANDPPFLIQCRLMQPNVPAVAPIDAPFSRIVESASRAHGVEGRLVHALIWAESSYDPKAVSSSGAEGLMQLMPATAKRYGVRDAFDPKQNIDGGVKHLRELLDQFDGDLELVVAAYNAGANAVIRAGNRIPPYPQTAAYVPKVIAYYHHLAAR